MIKKIIKEIVIFLIVVIIMSFVQHSDMGIERVKMMFQMGNFLHPILWSILPYLLLAGLRFAIYFVLKSIKKDRD